MCKTEKLSFRVIENHPNDSRVKLNEDNTFQALTSRMGTGGVILLLLWRIERRHTR